MNKVCKFEGCSDKAAPWKRGYCQKHFDLTNVCFMEGCEKPILAKGACQAHYQMIKIHGQPVSPKTGKKPGPKPDPTKPRSRHGAARQAEGTRRKYLKIGGVCPGGHRLTEDNTHRYLREDTGKEKIVCRDCIQERYRAEKGGEVAPSNASKTHCPRGHEYSADNTYVKTDGSRLCRKCRAINGRARRYKLTAEDFDALWERQGGGCAICLRPFSGPFGKDVHIDHDHSCCSEKGTSCGGCVRGLLCEACNLALGKLNDDAERVRRALEYLSA